MDITILKMKISRILNKNGIQRSEKKERLGKKYVCAGYDYSDIGSGIHYHIPIGLSNREQKIKEKNKQMYKILCENGLQDYLILNELSISWSNKVDRR